jgi:acetyl/propionyl-CoA carboxylase alpha subunit
MGGPAAQSIGLRTPAFLRLRARRTGERLELEAGDTRFSGQLQRADGGRWQVDAGAGTRELELIRHGDRLQIVGAQADEITLACAWPHELGVEDADAHPASPLPGRVVDLRVQPGDRVAKGDVLAVVEGMKMQHAIRAGRAGRVTQVLARAGELVEAEAVLFDIEPL